MMRSRLLRSLLICTAIQWIVCFFPVMMVHRTYADCQVNAGCREHDPKLATDAEHSYFLILLQQFAQPALTALLLESFGSATARGKHMAKHLGLALASAIIVGLTAFFFYEASAPMTGIGKQTNDFVRLYFLIPIFPAVSAIAGGLVCEAIDWHRGSTSAANQFSNG